MIPLKDDNPTKIVPFVTVALIAINVLVYLYQFTLDPRLGEVFIYQFGAIPAVVFGSQSLPPEIAVIPASLSVITSMFLHGSLMHLLGNMLYLWIFGNNIEDAMLHVKYLGFYFVTGVAAAFAHALTNPGSTIPTVGASGAISGVLGAYLLLYPQARVLVLIPLGFFTRLMYIPAWIVLGLWFLLQLFSGSMSAGQPGGGVAWFAHIGGFVAGMMLVGVFKQRDVRFFNPPHYRSTYDRDL